MSESTLNRSLPDNVTRSLGITTSSTFTPEETKRQRTCRVCYAKFLPETNDDSSCIYHPESFSGETAQRWMDPGDAKGGAEVYHFYSCCGGPEGSAGCCRRRHITFDEEVDVAQRRPGMGSH